MQVRIRELLLFPEPDGFVNKVLNQQRFRRQVIICEADVLEVCGSQVPLRALAAVYEFVDHLVTQ